MPADADLHAAVAWRDRLAGRTGWRILGALIERVQDAEFQRDVLLLAIRRHRDAQGEARGARADTVLYAWLPPGAEACDLARGDAHGDSGLQHSQ